MSYLRVMAFGCIAVAAGVWIASLEQRGAVLAAVVAVSCASYLIGFFAGAAAEQVRRMTGSDSK